MAQNNKINFQIDFKKGDVTALNSLKKDIAEIQRLAGDIDFTSGKSISEIQNMAKAARALESAMNQAFDVNLNTVNVQKFNNLLRQSGYNAETLQADLANAGATGQQAFLKATTQLMQFNTATKQTNKFLDSIATSLGNTIKWSVMSSIVNNISSTIQKSYYYVKDLDSALNDIRIVTGKSADEMSRFAESANNAAKSLAVTTEDYTQGSLIYYQQGLDDETVKTLTDITAMTSNVTGQAMSTVSEQLTAVWNGYQVANRAATEGMQVYEEYVDKLAAVGATTASDLEELSTAMSKVASAASSMGVGFDDLNAQIATIVSVTRQAPESVGTALKTIYARLGDLKVDGVDEFGTKLGEVSSQLQTMGINILDTNGDMRDMTSVMAEVAQKWDAWTSAQKQAAAIAMAGKRQYNNLVALFDNWDMYGEALETSMEAAGTLQEQQAIAMDSLANKMDVLKSTAEDLYDSLFNTNTIAGWVETGTGALQFLADFSDAVGGLNNLLPILGSLGLQVFSEQIGRGLSTIVINARNANTEISTMKANQEALQSMFQGSSFLAGDANAQTAQGQNLRELISFYSEMTQYQSIMSQEQKEQYNNLLNMKEAAGSLALEVEEEAKSWSDNSKYLKVINSDIIDNLENLSAIDAEATKINNIAGEIQKNIGLDMGDNSFDAIFEKLNLTEKETQQLVKLFEGDLKNAAYDVDEALQSSANRLLKFAQGLNEISTKQSKINGLNDSFKNISKTLSSEMGTQAFITNTTKALGSVGQLASSINTLSNLWNNVWTNESLSASERALQTIMNLSFALPMLGGSISKITGLLLTYNDAQSVSNILSEANRLNSEKNIAIKEAESLAEEAKAKSLAATNAQTKLNNLEEERENIAAYRTIARNDALSKILDQQTVVKKANAEATIANTAAEEAAKKAKEAEAAATLAESSAETQSILSSEGNIGAKTAEIIAVLSHKKAVDAETYSLVLNKAAQLGVAAALGIVIGALALVNAHYEAQRKHAHEVAEESFKAAEAVKEEAKAHNDLIKEFDELKERYDAGEISKDSLWDVTNKLIEAYDLESSRLDMLAGKYDKVQQAIKGAQEAEQEEIRLKNEKAIKDAREEVVQQGRKGWNSGIHSGKYRITLGKDSFHNLENKELLEEAKKIFGEEGISVIDNDKMFSIKDLSFNPKDTKALEENIHKLEQWSLALSKFGLEGSNAYKNVEKILKGFNKEGALDSLNSLLSDNLSNILNSSNLDSATTKEDFNSIVNNLKNTLSKSLSEGMIPSDTDVDKVVSNYISKITTSFAEDYTLESALEDKFDKNLNNDLVEYFKNNANKETQLKIIDWFDFSMDTEKGKQLLDGLINFYNTEIKQTEGIPVNFQVQLNDSILKGKDISKSDWENILASNSQAESILGDREAFNNKSIGERIALMKELNELTRQANIEAIKNYDEAKKSSEQNIQIINEQIAVAEASINSLENLTPSEKTEETEKKIEELQNYIFELTNQKYEIEIGLNMEQTADQLLKSMVGDVITQSDQLLSATEAIGEGWKVAAEDVAQFASAFPELMDDIEAVNRLEDGSIQLNKDKVNEVLQGNQDIIESNKEIVLQEIDDKISQLKAEKDFQKAKLDALNEYLAADVDNTEAEAKATSDIAQAAQNYKNTLRENDLIDNSNAIDQAITNAETGANGMIESLNAVNEAIKIIHANYANALVKDADMQDITTSAGGATRTSNTFSSTSNENYEGDDAIKKAAIEAAKAARDEAEARISEIDKEIASYEGFRSDVLSRTYKANQAANRVKKGKAGKEETSKSGGKDKKKDLKELDEEFDRYWEIKKAIDMLDLSISRLEKDQKNLHGQELINSLKKENELLAEQKANYEALYKMQQEEQAELQAKLAGSGVIFDASGAITNYAQATAAALAQYTAAVNAYNAGLIDDTAFEVQEKAYENFKKTLERYEALYYKEMQDTQDKIDDARRKQLENNLKAWETEIQIKLDLQEAERQWADFLKNITEDFQSVFKDLTVDMDTLLSKSKTYTGKNGKDGTIGADIAAIQDVMREIDKMKNGVESSMFESISQAQEKLKELQEKLQKDAQALRDLWKEGYELYLKQIDQVADKFEAIQKRFNDINNQIKFYADYLKLVGNTSFSTLNKIMKAQEKALENQLSSLQKQADMFKNEFYAALEREGLSINDPTKWTEEIQSFYEKWQDAQGKVNDLAIDFINLLQEDYSDTIDNIIKESQKALFNGLELDEIRDNWERIKDYSDKYKNDIEKSYELNKFSNKVQQEMAGKTLKTQQKLEEFRKKQLEDLRAQKNLTQYDLDAADAKLQIMLKEIALEEAQQNKTTMKMTRNEQGNWSYQYVADEDDQLSKRQELIDSWNDLYALADEAETKNIDAIQQMWDTYYERWDEIKAVALEDAEKASRMEIELNKWKDDELARLTAENLRIRDDLNLASAGLLMEIYEGDEEAYENMTENEQEMVKNLTDNSIEDYQGLEDAIETNLDNIGDNADQLRKDTRVESDAFINDFLDKWNNNPDSVKKVLVQVTKDIRDAFVDYQKKVDDCSKIINLDIDNIDKKLEDLTTDTDELNTTTDKLVDDSVKGLDDMRDAVDALRDAWEEVEGQIMDTIEKLREYINLQAKAEGGGGNNSSNNNSNNSNNNGGPSPNSNNGDGDNDSKQEDNKGLKYKGAKITWYDPDDMSHHEEKKEPYSEAKKLYNKLKEEGNQVAIYPYKTGGYTGDWGTENGRPAILHQKELVLNKQDTVNFLQGISLLRDMTALNGSISGAISNAVMGMAMSLGTVTPSGYSGSSSTETNNGGDTFNITAEFPNANDVNEIREAILSLPRLASQYIGRNLK